MKATNGQDIYKLIEQERKERRYDIAEIHTRIDEVLKAVQSIGKGNGASWVRQSVGLTIAVITLIGFFMTIIVGMTTPMNQNIAYVKENLYEYKAANTTERNQFMALYDKSHEISQERINARFLKLEQWQKYWYQNDPAMNARQNAGIEEIKVDLNRINVLFKIREENIKMLNQ